MRPFRALPAFALLLAAACSGSEATEEDGSDEGALLGDDEAVNAFAGEAAPGPSLPANFQSLDAHEKQRVVWERVIDPGEIRCNLAAAIRNAPERMMDELATCAQAGGLPKSTVLNSVVDGGEAIARKIFADAGLLRPAFDASGDEMAKDRKKLLHPYGATAKVEFRQVANDTGYTGLFAGGPQRPFPGVARISSGGAESLLGGFVPGMGLKFFVQAAPSIDMHVMHGMGAQKEDEGQNPFARPFSNEFKKEGATLLIRAGMKIFDLIHNPSNLLPLDQTAVRAWNGSTSVSPVAPSKIVFTPTADIRAAAAAFVRAQPGADHRIVLAAVTKGAGEGDRAVKLYDVRTDRGVELGALYATSAFVPSRYGDRQLFIRHHHGCDRKDAPPACGGMKPRIQ